MRRVVVMGPPGVGKGTQTRLLAAQLGVPGISTGDMFRALIAERAPLGVQLQSLIESGEYVPDELTNQIVADRLGRSDAQNGFVLDGYPRTDAQADELDRILAMRQTAIDVAVLLAAGSAEIAIRLRSRATSEGRADDADQVVTRRLEVYGIETAPLVERYRGRGLLREVSSEGPVDEVADRMREAVQ